MRNVIRREEDRQQAPISRQFVLLTIALLLIVPLLALTIVKLYGPQIEREAYASLEVVARLKAEQLERWLAEQHVNGQALANNAGLIELIAALPRNGNPDQEERVRLLLERIRQTSGYPALKLVDPQGKELLSLGEQHSLSPEIKEWLPSVFAIGAVQHG